MRKYPTKKLIAGAKEIIHAQILIEKIKKRHCRCELCRFLKKVVRGSSIKGKSFS